MGGFKAELLTLIKAGNRDILNQTNYGAAAQRRFFRTTKSKLPRS
jgi:hypothetical protein